MVDIEKKICVRNGCTEGSRDPDGNDVTFDYGNKKCDRCTDYNRKSHNPFRSDYARVKFPTPHNIGVYAFTLGKEIVYIGSSDNLPFRLYKHFEMNNTFDDGLTKLKRKFLYRWNVVWHGDSLEDAQHQEKALIQIHQPKYNKIKYKNYAT